RKNDVTKIEAIQLQWSIIHLYAACKLEFVVNKQNYKTKKKLRGARAESGELGADNGEESARRKERGARAESENGMCKREFERERGALR
ncbi:hypothetical protein SMA49_26655, partial [Escherichia coli]|uniref:hypothetical protein n=1 Tax=Escherichia coli TaxID=562 RepID=UPI003078D86B